jgi:hypothetical protein
MSKAFSCSYASLLCTYGRGRLRCGLVDEYHDVGDDRRSWSFIPIGQFAPEHIHHEGHESCPKLARGSRTAPEFDFRRRPGRTHPRVSLYPLSPFLANADRFTSALQTATVPSILRPYTQPKTPHPPPPPLPTQSRPAPIKAANPHPNSAPLSPGLQEG